MIRMKLEDFLWSKFLDCRIEKRSKVIRTLLRLVLAKRLDLDLVEVTISAGPSTLNHTGRLKLCTYIIL